MFRSFAKEHRTLPSFFNIYIYIHILYIDIYSIHIHTYAVFGVVVGVIRCGQAPTTSRNPRISRRKLLLCHCCVAGPTARSTSRTRSPASVTIHQNGSSASILAYLCQNGPSHFQGYFCGCTNLSCTNYVYM